MSDSDDVHLIAESRQAARDDDSTRPTWRQWLAAHAATRTRAARSWSTLASGAFGHRVSMLDFSPQDLDRFRQIGEIVKLPDIDGVAESALALSGSAAQSKIQTFPGDCDYFQRRQHQGRDPRGGVPVHGGPHARQGAVHDPRRHLPVPRGEARQLPVRLQVAWVGAAHGRPAQLEPRRDPRRREIAELPDGRRRRAVGRGRARSGLVQARLGGQRPDRAAAVQRQQRDRRDLGGAGRARSCRSTATWTRTSRRSTSTPTRCRRSEGRQVRHRRRARRVRGPASSRRCTSTSPST